MKTMEQVDGNLINRYQSIITKKLKKHPELRQTMQTNFKRYSWKLLGKGMSHPILVSSHDIELILEGLRLGSPDLYKKHIDAAIKKFRDAKASENDCTLINMPDSIVHHIVRGLEEFVETAEARELAAHIVAFFDIDRLHVSLPGYFYDHMNQQEYVKKQAELEDSVYDGGYELSSDLLG